MWRCRDGMGGWCGGVIVWWLGIGMALTRPGLGLVLVTVGGQDVVGLGFLMGDGWGLGGSHYLGLPGGALS